MCAFVEEEEERSKEEETCGKNWQVTQKFHRLCCARFCRTLAMLSISQCPSYYRKCSTLRFGLSFISINRIAVKEG